MGETSTHQDEVVVFLNEVRDEGFITDFTAETLLNYRFRQLNPASQPVVAHPAFVPVSPPQAQAISTPAVVEPTTPPAAAFVPRPPRRRTRAEVWARYTRQRSKKMWGALSADFAANALTYLGVLLSVVVIFAFFAFGYFGEFIDADHKEYRPLAEVGVVAFFLGLAWVLRHRTGIPQTSAAIEMIGIILIPVMLSASFRDGYPPDVNGSARWAAYGLAALASTGIYYLYARRRSIYAYLVGPMLWVAVGAFALYLDDGMRLIRDGDGLQLRQFTSDGISASQLIAVLAAIGVSVSVAGRVRNTRVGKLLAVPVMRSGVIALPFVLTGSLVFAYNDALARGISRPDLGDMAWPNVVATAIAAAVLAVVARSRFAWAHLSDRLQGDIANLLGTAAHVALAAAWLFTAGFGVSAAWLGTGLVGYAAVVIVTDRYSSDDLPTTVWIVRVAVLAGAALSLIEPVPATITWMAISGLAIAGVTHAAASATLARYAPVPSHDLGRHLQVWVPVLVVTGAGLARLGWPEATPYTLLAVAGLLVAARLVPNHLIRTFAGGPAAAVLVGAIVAELWKQAGVWDYYPLGAYLAGAAVLATLMTLRPSIRLGSSVVLGAAAGSMALRGLLGDGRLAATWIDTAVLAGAGLALLMVAQLRRSSPIHLSGLGHVLVGVALVRSIAFDATAILGLGAVVVAYALETVRIETGRDSLFGDIDEVPAFAAAGALAPLAMLVGDQIPWIATDGTRFGLVLAGLSWVYATAAVPARRRIRSVAIPLAYVASLGAIAIAIPSVTSVLATSASAALLTAGIAIGAKRPAFSAPSWILAILAALSAAIEVGVDEAGLYLVLHVAAVAMVIGGSLLARSAWSRPPMAIGAVLLPVAVAFGEWTTILALSAAVSYAVLGWSVRVGAFSIPAAFFVAVSYGSILHDTGWADIAVEPLLWMPLAAAFVAVSAMLPGNRGWRIMSTPASGLLGSGLTLAALVLYWAAETDVALVGAALILIETYVIRRDHAWLVGAAVSLVLAGLVAGGFWAPLATALLTLVIGYLADRRHNTPAAPTLRGMAAVSLGVTHGLVGSWQGWSAHETVAVTAAIAAVMLTVAAVAELRTSLAGRVREWRLELFGLSQAGLIVVVFVAGGHFQPAAAAGVVAAGAGFEALVAAVVGSVRKSSHINVGAALISIAAYSQLAQWLTWTGEEFVTATGSVAVSLAIIATMATRAQADSPTLRSWVAPLHGLTLAAAGGVLAELLEPDRAGHYLWAAAAVFVGLGIHIAANAWAAPREWQPRGVAVASFLVSAGFAMAAVEQGPGSVHTTALGVAGMGLVVAVAAGSIAIGESVWRRELGALFAGLEVVVLVGLLQRYEPLDTEMGVLLVVIGAALVAYGVLARKLEVVEGSLVVWLGALLILVNDQIGLGLHAVVLSSSICLLGVLELERVRGELDESPQEPWINVAEWLLISLPLGLAAAEMLGSLWFGLVLFAEGLALATWGTLTQVRRRALLGVAAMAMAIVLAIAIPTVHGLMVGLSAGTWMAVGAVVAVVFIAAGSAIERQRHAIGRRLARVGEILDSWG